MLNERIGSCFYHEATINCDRARCHLSKLELLNQIDDLKLEFRILHED